MRSTFAMTLFSFGLIFLSFGAVVLVIELVGARFGVPHETGGVLALGFLVGGGILAGAGVLLNRSRGSPTSSN